MSIDGPWGYYTVMEAAEVLVVKLPEDEFQLGPDDYWTRFDTDCKHPINKFYAVELKNRTLPMDYECIRRLLVYIKETHEESMHFI